MLGVVGIQLIIYEPVQLRLLPPPKARVALIILNALAKCYSPIFILIVALCGVANE